MIDKSHLESWLYESRSDTCSVLELKPRWWPTTNGDNQSIASAWATCFFLQATSDLYGDDGLEIFCSKGYGHKSRRMIGHFDYKHSYEQLMLDSVVGRLSDRMPVKLTAESEMSPTQSVGFAVGEGYLWDFYKLLMVPSPVRLFMARVASLPGQSAIDRMAMLAEEIIAMHSLYCGGLFSSDSEFGVVILPAAKRDRAETLILWAENGTLRGERISEFPL